MCNGKEMTDEAAGGGTGGSKPPPGSLRATFLRDGISATSAIGFEEAARHLQHSVIDVQTRYSDILRRSRPGG